MSPVRSRLAPAARRRQILDAARDLFADRPYEEVSVRELAEAAGVARGLINHYFGDKRELFLAVMRDSIVMPRTFLPELDEFGLEQRARITIEWIMDAALSYGQAWVNASGTANLRGDADVQAIVDDADDRAARLVLDALGLADSPALRYRLRAFAAMVKATIREWLQHESMSREQALELLTSTMIHIVQQSQLDKEAAS